jgi:hypothetical protein
LKALNYLTTGLFWFLAGFVITSMLLFSCSGCGFQQTLRTHCKLGDTQTCDTLFGTNQYEIDAAQDNANKVLALEVASIKQTVDNLINDVRFIESQLLSVNTLINMLQQDINANYELIQALQQNSVTLTERLDYQQVIINNHQIELTQLAMEDTVVEYLDPCGNGSGFDEVLLHTRSGKYVAYFESGSNRFLTVLQSNTTYRTTDSQKCYFTLNNDGQIVNEHL